MWINAASSQREKNNPTKTEHFGICGSSSQESGVVGFLFLK